MKIFNFGQAISKGLHREHTSQDLQREAESFDLAGTGGYLAVVKYAVFAVLAVLNCHLFLESIPGLWGVAVACTAMLFEGMGIYCWNKQNKSAGSHQAALRIFAVLFTVVSFVHGCAALYEISGAGPSLAPVLAVYSKYVAFPLLFGLMTLAVCTLYYLHWSTAIAEARASAQLRAAQGRAELITQSLEIQNQAEIEKQRLSFFEQQILIEEAYVQGVEKFAAIKARGERALQSITDPEVRRELFSALGRISTGDAPAKRIPSMAPAATRTEDPKA